MDKLGWTTGFAQSDSRKLWRNREHFIFKTKNEEIECPNCYQKIEEINQTEYNLVRDLSILGKRVYLEVPRRQFHCEDCQKYITERLDFMRLRKHYTIRYEGMIYEQIKKKNIEEIKQEEEIG